ncbi:glycosyltransferase family 2 protein [Clostridium botulinum]|uniref:glycosyltransferase family 2 protein n=1 Tax=Clostridium botulinum TaxID=1491 RepID=UPI0007735427|nr:glycosyltransferase [Clostridium botulinum]NFE95394.1 glycosyltransferase [Clostridium botulinum]NFL38235.1 glycosyltransferase [Clostridium botulinum]NFL64714.1 glycosyltransferase [Clostridium botulinum]NFN08038.1 glycosyltransferase [Clostridium botulinum]NFN24237.1 glycosyltransferase [Clostridium botulinum]
MDFESNKNNDVIVSIVVITYGHEKYIRQALDSVLMQTVNFNYEIIVGEDCSPDKTRKILKEYETNYPDRFIMIYRERNVGARRNAYDVQKRCRGRYIAYLEGDDYWTDEYKLQKQVDFLESNKDFIAVTHKVTVVDENSNEKNEIYPCCKHNIYSLKHYKKDLLPSQSASILRRNYYKNYFYDDSILGDPKMWPGDRLNSLIMVSLGKVYCMKNVMSAYRHVTSSGTSFSATHKERTNKEKIDYYITLIKFNNEQLRNNDIKVFLKERLMEAVIRHYGIKNFSSIKKYWNMEKKEDKFIIFILIFIRLISWPLRKITRKIQSRYFE